MLRQPFFNQIMKSCIISLLQILDSALFSLNCPIFLFSIFGIKDWLPARLEIQVTLTWNLTKKANLPKNDANSMRHALNERTKKGDNSLKFRDIQI